MPRTNGGGSLAGRNSQPAVRKAIHSPTGEGQQFHERMLTAGVGSGRRLGVRSAVQLRLRYEQFIADLVINGLKAQQAHKLITARSARCYRFGTLLPATMQADFGDTGARP
jgi:hypothetical protein